MADAAALKSRVEAYLTQLQGERDKAAKTYQAELDRMDSQIAASQRVLAAWGSDVDALIGTLNQAGIQIQL